MSSKRWSEDELKTLEELYQVYGPSKIGEMLGRTTQSVTLKANRMGIYRNRHQYDKTYFNEINSADKAYWLGFIAADGYVIDNPLRRTYELGIELCSRDDTHLRKFIEAIDSDISITYRERQNFLDRGYDTVSHTAQIRIFSIDIVRDLSQYGIVQNKTKKMTQLPDVGPFVWDYIRGYFDGDGTFAIRNAQTTARTIQYGTIGFVCYRKEFLESLKVELDKVGISSHMVRDGNVWQLSIRQTSSVINFLNLIYYSDKITKLDRKYEKVINFYNGMPASVATPA